MEEEWPKYGFPVSECADAGSATVGPSTSTPVTKQHTKPPYRKKLNEIGIMRALFDETLSPLDSGESDSDESLYNLEQIGA